HPTLRTKGTITPAKAPQPSCVLPLRICAKIDTKLSCPTARSSASGVFERSLLAEMIPMNLDKAFLARHQDLTRRHLLKLGVASLAMPALLSGTTPARAATGGSLLPNAEEKAKRFG